MKHDQAPSALDQDITPLLDDAPFNKHSMNGDAKGEGHKISPFAQGEIHTGVTGIKVRLLQGLDEDQLRTVLGRATLATIGVDPDVEPEQLPWEEMFKGGLQTALESQVVVFEIAGISRTCTHQLVRSRRAAFHQQSQRASFMGEEPNVRVPQSIARDPELFYAYTEAIKWARRAYQMATENDVAYQDARFILPEGTETYIMCEYPLREFLNAYAYRACTMFQWEIMYCFREMGRLLIEAHPWIAQYIKITCEKDHICHFQGWERVEGHCPFPWAREDNRTYRPDKSLTIGG